MHLERVLGPLFLIRSRGAYRKSEHTEAPRYAVHSRGRSDSVECAAMSSDRDFEKGSINDAFLLIAAISKADCP